MRTNQTIPVRKFSIRYPYAIEPEQFWREVYFDRDYTERLAHEAYRYFAYEIVEETGMPDGRRTRKARVTSKFDAPPAVRKLVGDSMSFLEIGELEIEGPNAPRWVTRLLPNRSAVVSVSIAEWLERTGPGQSVYVAEAELVSRSTEVLDFVETLIRECYERGSRVTDQWLREHRDVLTGQILHVETDMSAAFANVKQSARHS